MKIGQNSIYALFAQRPSIINFCYFDTAPIYIYVRHGPYLSGSITNSIPFLKNFHGLDSDIVWIGIATSQLWITGYTAELIEEHL